MFVSTFLVVLLGTLITDKIVEPRLGEYKGQTDATMEKSVLNAGEKKGLIYANIFAVLVVLGVLLLTVFPDAPLRGEDGSIIESPFISSIIFIMMLVFLVPGIVYGAVTRQIRNDKDVVKLMDDSIMTMAGFIVLIFFAVQFVALFVFSILEVIHEVYDVVYLCAMNIFR